MDIQNEINLFELKLKRYRINFYKHKQQLIIKKSSIDLQQLLIYFTVPLILGISIIIGVLLFFFIYGIYLPRMKIIFAVYILGFLSGSALISFAYASFFRIQKKKKENHASKILYNRKLIFETEKNETTYDFENVTTIKNSIEIHDDNIFMGNVFLVDKEGNQITILSLEGFESNFLRDDLVWFEKFFKKYLELKL